MSVLWKYRFRMIIFELFGFEFYDIVKNYWGFKEVLLIFFFKFVVLEISINF